ncbi:MAG: adenylyltransferase/cytidyltransferase family protein [Alphaproteobacteria bacterium]|nr:adenylyltransferase/cytidyltransferase family protein [Alphaproteobacteria bacterium]
MTFFPLFIFLFLASCASYTPHTTSDSSNARITLYDKNEARLEHAQKIVLVGGCFDVLHYGHIQFLEHAKSQGDYLIIALEPDASIINYKKHNPIHAHDKRARNLAALRVVDEVIMLPIMRGYDDYLALVKHIQPAVVAITNGDPQLLNKKRQAEEVGARVAIVIERIPHYSSTAIINGDLK